MLVNGVFSKIDQIYVIENNIKNMERELHLTSARVDKQLYEIFQNNAKGLKITLGDVVERALYLFLTDSEIKSKLRNTKIDFTKLGEDQ